MFIIYTFVSKISNSHGSTTPKVISLGNVYDSLPYILPLVGVFEYQDTLPTHIFSHAPTFVVNSKLMS